MDVNHIFKDLGQLVHDQGETVDSIEAQVELASTQITEGAQQLRLASESQVCYACGFSLCCLINTCS